MIPFHIKVLASAACLTWAAAGPNGPIRAQEAGIEDLLERVAAKVASYPELPDMEARALSTLTEMDQDWKPKKQTRVEKIIHTADGIRTEEIISAREHEKGKVKDVTARFREEAEENAQKARRRKAEGGGTGEDGGGGHRELSMEEMFPFSDEKRTAYEFSLLGGSYVGTRPVHVLEAKAKNRSDEWIEGRYYIDKTRFDVLQAEVGFAKNPKMVKRFEMEARFQVLAEGLLVLKHTRVRIHVGLVVKNIRMEVEEEYSDYRVFDRPVRPPSHPGIADAGRACVPAESTAAPGGGAPPADVSSAAAIGRGEARTKSGRE